MLKLNNIFNDKELSYVYVSKQKMFQVNWFVSVIIPILF